MVLATLGLSLDDSHHFIYVKKIFLGEEATPEQGLPALLRYRWSPPLSRQPVECRW